MSGPCPRGRSSSRARPCCASTAPLAAGQWVETLPAGLARLSDPGGFQGGADRHGRGRTAAFRVRRPARPRTACGLAGGALGHDRRLRRDEPRRGRAAAGNPGRRHDGPLLGPILPDARPRRSRRSPASSPETPHSWSTPTTRSKECATPPRSSRPSRRSGIDSGDLGALAQASPRDPRRARAPEREDHGLRRSRRVPDRRARRLGRADRRLRGRHRADHLSRLRRRWPWSTSSSSSTARASSS